MLPEDHLFLFEFLDTYIYTLQVQGLHIKFHQNNTKYLCFRSVSFPKISSHMKTSSPDLNPNAGWKSNLTDPTGISGIALTLISACTAPDGYTSWQAYISDLDHLTGLPSVPSFFSAKAVMGDAGLWVIALAALAAILTSMIAAYRAATRMLATIAENHILSEKFLKTNHSIMIVMVIAILISILGKNFMRYFLDLASMGAVIGFGYISLSAWKLARKNGSGVSAARKDWAPHSNT